jgi:hypothetical protein
VGTGNASSFTKNSASSKQIIMSRSGATNENMAREGTESAPASNLGNKVIFDAPIVSIK